MPDATVLPESLSLSATGADLLERIVLVMDEPQDVVNIAGVIRVMKNMGLRHLRVVRPAEWDAWRITGIAHRSDDVVERTGHFATLAEALADCTFVIGTSARARTAQRNYGYARGWASVIARRCSGGEKVAIVFGREDRGLSNEALDRCDGVALIPTSPEYASLNLAQAALVLCYEVFMAAHSDALEALPRGKRSAGPVTRERFERMHSALEGALERIGFFHARESASVMRTFRTLFSRADLDQHEAGLVQALGYEVQKFVDVRLPRLHVANEGAPSSSAEGPKGDGPSLESPSEESPSEESPSEESLSEESPSDESPSDEDLSDAR
jgi:tRNA/rRNA methyltransferase/tRNA (cytidine32/uridine32-2'-O)-methyltransferase